MTKRVQILGHIAELALQFIGFEREVTADTDNWDLILHDGVTPGGYRFLNRDANDERYQARSVELDGLLGWEPNERGIVVRLGPSTYRLREIAVDENNMQVLFPDGHDGNPKLALADEIVSDHTFSGNETFTQPILANGGVVGDVLGNLEGDVTGNLTGDSFGHHTGDVTGNVEGDLTGGIDTRGKTVVMDPDQIDQAWVSGLTESLAQVGVPIGGIIPFGLAISDIPANWKLCDGSFGTPDLRDRFVVSYGVDTAFGSSGGAATHDHDVAVASGGAHTHTGTVGDTVLTIGQMPAHWHASGICEDHDKDKTMNRYIAAVPPTSNGLDKGGSGGNFEAQSSTVGGDEPHTHELTTDAGGAHTHVGSASVESNLPPYYALYYIMRVE